MSALAAQPVRLTYWNCFTEGDMKKGMLAVVAEFNRTHTDVQVDMLDVPLIEDKLLMTVAGGAPPDAVLFDRFRIPQYAALGAFTPLEELAQKGSIQREDFFSAAWDECLFENHLWGIPFNTDVRVLFWNKKLFREAGLDRAPRDWEELVEFSKKLTKPADKSQPLSQVGFVPLFGNTWLYLYGWQKGASFVDAQGNVTVNQPPTLSALTWLKGFVDWYGSERVRRFESGFGIHQMNPFISGKLAMVGDEVSLMSTIERYRPSLEYDVAPLPWPKDGVHATWSGGFSIVIPRGARHMAASWEFVRFMTGRDGQNLFGKASRCLPANSKATEDPFYQENPKWRVMIGEMAFSRFRPVSVVGSEVWEAMLRARDFVSYGVKAPEKALNDAQAEIDGALRQAKKIDSYPLVDWKKTLLYLVPFVALLLLVRAGISFRIYLRDRFFRREARWAYLMAAPAIIGLLVFQLGPIIASALLSFTSYDVLNPARAVGVENYTRMFTEDQLFGKVIWNTFVFVLLNVPLTMAAAVGTAILVNQPLKGKAFFRTIYFLPVITPVIAGSLLWMWIFNAEYGILNAILRPILESNPVRWLAAGATGVCHLLGYVIPSLAHVRIVPEVPNWLTDPFWAKPSIVFMSMWGFGQAMVIFLAGLQRIPEQIYEAATIDGAGSVQKLRYVTLPLLSPTIFFNLIIAVIGSLQVFTQVFVMTYGGPVDSTRFYVLHLYRQAFVHLRMGYASALAWVLFIVILLLTLFQFRMAKRWVHYD